jgi:predicted nucleotidyltransferase
MIDAPAIEELTDQIVRLFKPGCVILFGSHVDRAQTDDSDVDLLVVMPHRGPSYQAASRIRLAIDVAFPLDIVVRSPAELKRRLAINDFFLMDVIKTGLVLHDSNDSRVGQQGRRRLRCRLHSPAIPQAQPF